MLHQNQALDDIQKTLEEFYGKPIPNPHNYPQSFMWYLEMYREIKSVKK